MFSKVKRGQHLLNSSMASSVMLLHKVRSRLRSRGQPPASTFTAASLTVKLNARHSSSSFGQNSARARIEAHERWQHPYKLIFAIVVQDLASAIIASSDKSLQSVRSQLVSVGVFLTKPINRLSVVCTQFANDIILTFRAIRLKRARDLAETSTLNRMF